MEHSELQSTTRGFFIFADDSTAFGTGKTGLTISSTLAKASSTANSVSPTITEVSGGWYWVVPLAAHRDTLGRALWQFSASGAVIAGRVEKIIAANDQLTAFGANTTTPPTAGAIADAVYDEPYAGHTTNGTYGQLWDRWRKANPAVAGEVTNAITPTTTQFSTDITGYTNDSFKHSILLFVDGATYADHNSPISGYVSSNGVVTLEVPLPAAPAVGDQFVIKPDTHVHLISEIVSGVWSALTSGLSVVGSTGRALARLIGMVEDSSGDRFTAKALEQAPSGTSTVTVLPALGVAAGRGDRTTLVAYVAETITTSITVYQADGTTAYNLSGKTLTVIFENPKTGDDVAVVASGSITISGTDSNVVTFAYPSAATSAQRELTWTLRDAAAPKTVYLRGVLEVRAAATVDT